MQVEISTLSPDYLIWQWAYSGKKRAGVADFVTGHAYTVKVQRKLDSHPGFKMVSFEVPGWLSW